MSESTEGYDPATDPDADPDSLHPRTGDAARPGRSDGDPDADPDMLPPRGDEDQIGRAHV